MHTDGAPGMESVCICVHLWFYWFWLRLSGSRTEDVLEFGHALEGDFLNDFRFSTFAAYCSGLSEWLDSLLFGRSSR
jgi:hypothetical protein